jgi:hypothetical protein
LLNSINPSFKTNYKNEIKRLVLTNYKMEVWKQVFIDNIECDYEISNHGNLRCKSTLEPRIFNTHRGCYTCKIKVGEQIKLVRIARLVAQYFIPNDEELRFIKHVNGNVYDNRVENLKWSETALNDGPFIKKKPTLKIHPIKDLEDEIWKTLVMNGVEWNYEVSNLGRAIYGNLYNIDIM